MSPEATKGDPVAEVEDRSFERRTAQAMVATFLQMGRSAHLARWLHQARQRSLEKRVRAATEMKEIVGLQRRLDAQQSQAAVVEQAAARFRNRARELAQFARAGLTMDDFHRMGVQHVVDMEQFNAEVAKVQQETAIPTSPPESPPAASAGPPPPVRVARPPMRRAPGPRLRAFAAPAPTPAPIVKAAPAPAKARPAQVPAAKRAPLAGQDTGQGAGQGAGDEGRGRPGERRTPRRPHKKKRRTRRRRLDARAEPPHRLPGILTMATVTHASRSRSRPAEGRGPAVSKARKAGGAAEGALGVRRRRRDGR
jgi:hypothetical protein